NQNVKYKEIYVGYKRREVPEGHIGFALPAVPYVVLARDAVPKNGTARLLNMTIADWEKEMGFQPFRR
ncbi:MAG: histidine decarboxylase, pyruvoyl type, partial [Deltaproteobacteria bacterium]